MGKYNANGIYCFVIHNNYIPYHSFLTEKPLVKYKDNDFTNLNFTNLEFCDIDLQNEFKPIKELKTYFISKNGEIYKGVNCDGIHGSCAEYITMGIAISNGEREFDTIVAVHDKAPNCVVSPCGNCRQMLFEYCPDIKVIINDENGNLTKVTAKDLLPFAWHPVIC